MFITNLVRPKCAKPASVFHRAFNFMVTLAPKSLWYFSQVFLFSSFYSLIFFNLVFWNTINEVIVAYIIPYNKFSFLTLIILYFILASNYKFDLNARSFYFSSFQTLFYNLTNITHPFFFSVPAFLCDLVFQLLAEYWYRAVVLIPLLIVFLCNMLYFMYIFCFSLIIFIISYTPCLVVITIHICLPILSSKHGIFSTQKSLLFIPR